MLGEKCKESFVSLNSFDILRDQRLMVHQASMVQVCKILQAKAHKLAMWLASNLAPFDSPVWVAKYPFIPGVSWEQPSVQAHDSGFSSKFPLYHCCSGLRTGYKHLFIYFCWRGPIMLSQDFLLAGTATNNNNKARTLGMLSQTVLEFTAHNRE